MPKERVQKILAAAGYGSRRACETLIAAGRVQVNGSLIRLGDKADPQADVISVDGNPVGQVRRIYILVNKPRGAVSSLNAQGNRSTVRDLVPIHERLYPVGRLDIESEGLILLTNDGNLANRLMHPKYGHEKEYEVLVNGYPKAEQLSTWRRGVVLDGKWTSPAKVRLIKKGASGTWLNIILREGRKRQIRRTAFALGLRVKRLRRVRLGSLRLGSLKPGEWRELKPTEVDALIKHTFRVRRS